MNGGIDQSRWMWRPTQQEKRVYQHLYSQAMDKSGRASKTRVFDMLQKSGLHQGYVLKIWKLGSSSQAMAIGEYEFSVMMKMVSLAQSGRPVSLDNLEECVPPPKLHGIDIGAGMARSRAPSSPLQYAPQPTTPMDLDDIITSAQSTESFGFQERRPAYTPPRSPVSTIAYLDDLDAEDDAAVTLSMLTPELQTLAPRVPQKVPTTSRQQPPGLRIDTRLVPERPSDFTGQQTPLSTDSVTELLSRIDLMIDGKGHCSNPPQRAELQRQLTSTTALRSELEGKINELQSLCDAESDHNNYLVERLSREEGQVKTLSQQIDHARQSIAYIARQRAQLVDRLQGVAHQQDEMQARLRSAVSESQHCSADVSQLDARVFGMQRGAVRLQRQTRYALQGQAPGDITNARRHAAAASWPSSGGSRVLTRYQTAKRNRLSSVFVKPAAAV